MTRENQATLGGPLANPALDPATDSPASPYNPIVQTSPGLNPTILAIPAQWLQGDNAPDTGVDVGMHPLTLRFDDRQLEEEFAEEYFRRTLGQVRWALLVGLLLYSVYGVVDFLLAGDLRPKIWLIRYTIVAPVALACLAFSFTQNFRRYRDPAISAVILVALGGIIGMTSILPQAAASLYDIGLFMVIVYAFTLVRLSVPYAFAIALLTLGVYPLAALAVHHTQPVVVVANLGFLFGMIVMCFASNYAMGRYSRSNFLQRRLISLRTEELERKNSELVMKNQMLAESRAANLRTAKRSDQIFAALSEALPGHILDDKYRIEGKIGSGAFGTVYRGEHILLHHPVAIKVFRPAVGTSGIESLERFRLEGISACRVNHPNAVTVLDFDVSSGSLAYLVMELLEGRSLAQQLRAEGKLPPWRAAEIACAVCDALSQAHAVGIVHRDIKPSNVFLSTTSGEEIVKVIDFGIAKLTDESEVPGAESITLTGTFLGTPAYMAPERVFNQPYDGRADVYAVGVMIFEMIAGKLPFEHNAGGHLSLMRMHAMAKPPALSSVVPDVDPKLELAALLAMSKDSTDRPTAAELGSMLKNLIADTRTGPRNRRTSDLYPA
ncbi:MAG TPA: serine/threonine-protein kinase [Gemmatimonadaceae bacterium]|nr:serine/threonine-protein kinase [Gemmatimonadaceae bacterium]